MLLGAIAMCAAGQAILTFIGARSGPDGITELLRFAAAASAALLCFALALGLGLWGRVRATSSAARSQAGVVLGLAILLPIANAIHVFWWPSPERLVRAAGEGDLGVVERCLVFGIEADAKGLVTHGFGGRGPTSTALTAAAGGGHAAVIDRLLEAGADPRADAVAALAAAINAGHAELVEPLMVSPAHPAEFWSRVLWNGKDPEGRHLAALRTALELGLPPAPPSQQLRAMFLHDNRVGAVVTRVAPENPPLWIPLLKAIASRSADTDTVALYHAIRDGLPEPPIDSGAHAKQLAAVVRSGPRLDVRRLFDSTAILMLAAKFGDAELVAALLSDDVAPDAPETRFDHPRSPLSYAAANGHAAAARLLLEAGADATRRDGGFATPLHGAASSGSVATVELLLDQGVDPDVAESEISTAPPSHWAAFAGQTQIVRLLLARGADPERVGWSGRTLASIARRADDEALLALLEGFAGGALRP